MKKIHLILRTIVHLKCKQIAWQIFYRLKNKFFNYSDHINPKGALLYKDISPKVPFIPSTPSLNKKIPQNGELTFLNQKHKVGWPPKWYQTNLSKLWQYNLHYHDFIWDLNFDDARTMVLSWLTDYKFESKSIGWMPYPTSLRIGNWVKYFFGNHHNQTISDKLFLEKLIYSLSLQTTWLLKRIEYHLLANHLLENAVALCIVGSFFSSRLGAKSYRKGWDILKEQLPEQILADGSHFERSAMYHCRVLYCLSDLYNVSDAQCAGLLPYIEKMSSWLLLNRHPDGQIHLFNDAATNIYLKPTALLEYIRNLLLKNNKFPNAVTISDGAFACPSSGYYGWIGNDGTYLVCDAAPIGPDYQLGHAHADIFGFELSIRGQRVIVDAGTFNYDTDENRAFSRSTAAHNTIEVDGQDQCEMWGAFRVARRGRPHDVRFTPSEDRFILSGWHDGYTRLPGRPKHERRFIWDCKGRLEIVDKIISKKSHCIVNRLHFHPRCKVKQVGNNSFHITWDSCLLRITCTGYEENEVQLYDYSPEFGLKIPAQCLCLKTDNCKKDLCFLLEVLR